MKKFVVEVMTHGKIQTRLVPAKNEAEARRNCYSRDTSIISCVPYTGQKIMVSTQEDTTGEERLSKGCLAANRKRKGVKAWQQY